MEKEPKAMSGLDLSTHKAEQQGSGGYRHRPQAECSRRSSGTFDSTAVGAGGLRTAIRASDRVDCDGRRAGFHILSQQWVGGRAGAAECRLEVAVGSLGISRGCSLNGHLQLARGLEQATSGSRHRHLDLLRGDASHGGHVRLHRADEGRLRSSTGIRTEGEGKDH